MKFDIYDNNTGLIIKTIEINTLKELIEYIDKVGTIALEKDIDGCNIITNFSYLE